MYGIDFCYWCCCLCVFVEFELGCNVGYGNLNWIGCMKWLDICCVGDLCDVFGVNVVIGYDVDVVCCCYYYVL